MTDTASHSKPHSGIEAAQTFFKELMESIETLTGISELYGTRTLADVMYLQNAILDGTFIELYPDESSVLDVVDEMPSAAIWRQFIQVTEVEGKTAPQESSLLSQAKQLVRDIAVTEQSKTVLRTDTPNEILETLLFKGDPAGSPLQVAIAVGQRRWHVNYREYVLITGSRSDDHGTWWQYRSKDGREGECFAVLLAIRGDTAEALGFESDEAMQQHAKWLAFNGSQRYLDWAVKLIPSNDIAHIA